MTKTMTAMCLLGAIAATGCAGAGRRKAPAVAQMPYNLGEVEEWRSAFHSFLDDYDGAKSHEDLLKTVPAARELIGRAPAPRARALSLEAYCIAGVGAGDPAVWVTGCFDPGGPFTGSPAAGSRACLEGDLEGRLRAALEVGGASETQDLNATLKGLFRCHQQNGTVGELTKASRFAKGRFGLPLSMLAWSRGLNLALPTQDAVDRAANMMAVSLQGPTARRR